MAVDADRYSSVNLVLDSYSLVGFLAVDHGLPGIEQWGTALGMDLVLWAGVAALLDVLSTLSLHTSKLIEAVFPSSKSKELDIACDKVQ